MRKMDAYKIVVSAVLAIVCGVSAVHAQDVKDPLALGKKTCPCPGDEVDKTLWNSRIALGFSMTDGNSDTTLLNIDAKTEQEKDRNIWFFGVQERYGETDSETNVDTTSGKASYKRLLGESKRLYTGVGVDYLRDDISDIKYRVIPGAVLGYFIVKNDTVELNLDAGPSYVFEEVGGETNDYFAPKVGNGFKWQISPTSKIFETTSVLFDSENSSNYIVDATGGIETAVSESLSLIVFARNIRDNEPAEGKEKNDLAFITSIGYNF